MSFSKFIFCFVSLIFFLSVSAQRILYSEPEKDDTRRLNFEIVGKVRGNFLIYKNIHNKQWIAVLDNNMNQTGRTELDYFPDNDRLINVDFFPYSDFCYMIYEYQKKSVVYCEAVTIDGNGKKISGPVQLDTSHIHFGSTNKVYSTISSEDKNKIIIFKINSRDKKNYFITTLLLNDKLELLKKSNLSLSMEERNDYLGEFHLDDDGDLVFAKFYRPNSENIEKAYLIIKRAMSDELVLDELKLDKTYLDEIHIKVDNFNKRYFLISFYYNQRRGDAQGLYFYIWDKNAGHAMAENSIAFSDDLRKEAKGDASTRSAFDDYFIHEIVTKKDGGFIITGESYYTTSRFNSWNRWNYLYGSPFLSPMDYYYYYPYYGRGYYWGSPYSYSSSQSVRYHADNVAILSYDKDGKVEWNNVITKSQFDDESDDELSYQLMNTGGQLHFLFNEMEKRANLLNDYTITPEGQLNHNPTLKNLDRGYEFMPKYAKQVSAKQMIIPCLHRNTVCFGLLDYTENR